MISRNLGTVERFGEVCGGPRRCASADWRWLASAVRTTIGDLARGFAGLETLEQVRR